MHSLNTIHRLNAQAHSDSINYLRSRGRHVVAEYDGLTLMTVTPFHSREEAELNVHEELDSPSKRRELHYATVEQPPEGNNTLVLRDQSEDRALASN